MTSGRIKGVKTYSNEYTDPVKIAKMYESGMTPNEIIKTLRIPGVAKISVDTIYRRVIEGGGKLRGKGGRNNVRARLNQGLAAR